MGQETIDSLKQKIQRLQELLDSAEKISWQRAQNVIQLREENQVLLRIIRRENGGEDPNME